MQMQRHPFLLERAGERPIHGVWHIPSTEAKGTVLFLHGYKGYMDWGAWPMVGDAFAHAGWRFLRINFTHNGTTPSAPKSFNDLEGFAANTYSRELEESTVVLQALRAEGALSDATATDKPLAVIGHSRGGGVACLAASEANAKLRSQGKKGVQALVTWAAVADFASRFPKGAALKEWEQSGALEVINHRTRQRLWHNWSFIEDFTAQKNRLDIAQAVRQYAGRTLIVHGTSDLAVDQDHAHRLADWAQNGTLVMGEGMDHTFGAKEPWTEAVLPEALEAVTQTTLRFLEEGRAVQ